MKLGSAPVIEFELGQVVGSRPNHEVVQLLKNPTFNREAPAERLFQLQILVDRVAKARSEYLLHGRASRLRPAGSGNATSRRSSTFIRRYTHVLSALVWPSRSPIVFKERPRRRRFAAYE